jgi:hypothetical protein
MYLVNYSYESNNNDFYAGTPGPSNVLFYDGTYKQITMAEYKSWVSDRESLSFSENPPFVNVSTRPYDLHLSSPSANLFESGGLIISTPIAITDDFDGNARYPNSGYPNDPAHPASAPDVGADEFAGFRLDLIPPVIIFTALANTASLDNRLLTATITDAHSGVPVSGTGLPRLYWRITHGAVPGTWNNVTGVSIGGNQYTFEFGAGVAGTDIVEYYVVAQDLAATPNVGTNAPYDGAFTANPPACVGLPFIFDSYLILIDLCGSYNVGAGQTFETLSQAITALNVNNVTCSIVCNYSPPTNVGH